jgi:DNA polymerase gamma 1
MTKLNVPHMRKNELGYPVVSDEIHRKLFGTVPRPEPTQKQLDRAISLLEKFKIPVPVSHAEGMYDGPLPLPDLKGVTIEDHFEKIAEEQIGHHKRNADDFAKATLPPIPSFDDFVLNPGWTRYTVGEDGAWITETVDYPLESAFTFDTETFVVGGAFPIIGTALSSEAAYVWLAAELIDPSIPQSEWTQYEMIPIGEDRFVAGHNISYDRVRSREAYSLDRSGPENFYFDTLSAHIGVSGLASGQRWLYVLAGKDPEEMTEEEKQKLRFAPKWLEKGATNSLVECYNFHVYEVRKFFGDETVKKLGYGDKEVRDLFVTAPDLTVIRHAIFEALDYAIKDALYTAELFQALWPKYLDSTPSMVGLCGMYHLNGSVIPLPEDWKQWIQRCEDSYNAHIREMGDVCRTLASEVYEEWKELRATDPAAADQFVSSDPWLEQLDWEVKTTKGRYANVPNWYRTFVKDPDQRITTKSQLAHLMLKLKWEGSPIISIKDKGWCFYDEEGELTKIPHPKDQKRNVGVLLTKDFVDDMKVGRLDSDSPQAKRALEIANATSYWTSVRKRVMDRIFVRAHNPHGEDAYITLPEILAHGTVTRRTVEPLMVTMCSTKNWRIGTELKTRVSAPDGWKIVGADFDGQELQIASAYCDAWDTGVVGGSPMGFSVLSGSKEHGTDPHTALAKAAGVDRDTAKGVGFAVLYGAGMRTVANTIRRKFPDRNPRELNNLATKMLEAKKGFRRYRSEPLQGGTDSGCFNYMERIALKQQIPTLPCLGTKISTAMRPTVVGDDFLTSRINWTIQASGAEILATILTAAHWLMREFKINARFIISIHDEIWWMAPDKHAELWAVAYQIAHMYTWARFQAAVGLHDVPLSRAFFSSVAIDNRIRKTPHECTVSPSNPQGTDEPDGKEFSMRELGETGAIDRLKTRFSLVQRGLL